MEGIDFWRKYVFSPEREYWVWPEDYGLKYEEVCFWTSDGILLYGWWIPRGRFTVLFAHGNGGNISHRVDIAAKFFEEGFSVFLFDYRGYGKSKGRPTEKGTYKDAEGAVKYLLGKLGIPLSRIVPVGESMGAAVVVELCTRYIFRGAVIISPALSFLQVMSHLFPKYLLTNKLSRIYDSSKKISKIHFPVLIIHGDKDELVPFAQGKELFRRANPPKDFYRVRDAGHNDVYEKGGKRLFAHIREFVHKAKSVS
jgi:pimeloyl-ACP methyl ester carboxylesterase